MRFVDLESASMDIEIGIYCVPDIRFDSYVILVFAVACA